MSMIEIGSIANQPKGDVEFIVGVPPLHIETADERSTLYQPVSAASQHDLVEPECHSGRAPCRTTSAPWDRRPRHRSCARPTLGRTAQVWRTERARELSRDGGRNVRHLLPPCLPRISRLPAAVDRS